MEHRRPHQRHEHDEPAAAPCIDAGSFLLAERLCRLEQKLDRVLEALEALARPQDLSPEGVAAFEVIARRLERLAGPVIKPRIPETQKES